MAGIITASVILFLLVLILLPIKVKIKYDNKLCVKLYYAGIAVFNSEKSGKNKAEKPKQEETDENRDSKVSKVKKTVDAIKDEVERLGFKDFLIVYTEVIKKVFLRLLWLIKKLRFKLLLVSVTVATDNACDTAIEYGKICSAVYPLLSVICSNAKVKLKKIDIKTDFIKTEYEYKADVDVSVSLISILCAAVSLLKIFLSLKKNDVKKGEGEKTDE